MPATRAVKKVRIAGKFIGAGEPCFIIAEAGVNHNGDISLARKLIDAAYAAGADAVKFQTFTTESLVTESAAKAYYQQETTGSSESQYEMLHKLELRRDDFKKLADYARRMGIIFLSSPFDEASVNLLYKLDVPAFKVASGEITNLSLLGYIAKKRKPIILSTGMAMLDEVEEAIETIRREGYDEIILLHCVTSYPARIEDTNLRTMETLRRAFKIPVGLSDHSLGLTIPIATAALGASVIEKHFTLDKGLPGPDHRASLTPEELKRMVQAIRDVEKALGNGIKQPTSEEEENKRVARRSIVAARDITAGTVITGAMLAVKRPGTGLAPKHLKAIIGRKAKRPIKKSDVITWEIIGQ